MLDKMKNNPEIRAMIADINPDAIIFDDLDEAIIGMSSHNQIPVVVYDVNKIVTLLYENFKATKDPLLADDEDLHLMAEEYFQYNIEGTYLCEYTPMLVYTLK